MATCRLIVNGALRKLGRLGAGREPRVADQTDALAALQGMYSSWIAAGAFGRVLDVVPQGTVYTARGNERIFRTSEFPTMTVELPALVSAERFNDYGTDRRGYYGTLITVTTEGEQTIVDVQASQPVGCVEPPRDGAVVLIADEGTGNLASWLFDGTAKRWDRLDMLQLDQEAPRSVSDPEGLSAMLAIELVDQFGADIGPATTRQAGRFSVAMTHRYGMRRDIAQGVYV